MVHQCDGMYCTERNHQVDRQQLTSLLDRLCRCYMPQL
jgi:hypothetical protein